VAFPGTRTLRFASRAASLAATPEQLLLDVPLALALRRHAQHHYHAHAGCQLIRRN
jgi:hypothetical protein